VEWTSIKNEPILRAILQVRKAHEVAFPVWMLEINTLFNNINSLYEMSGKILLQTALNRRVFELVAVADKASHVIDRRWIVNQQEGSISLDHSDYRFY